MKKILISLAIILVVGAVGFGATRAYFSDTETSSGNTFTAGTLDLKTGYTTWEFPLVGMKPGSSTNEQEVEFSMETGSMAADHMEIDLDINGFVDSPVESGGVNSKEDFGKQIKVDKLQYRDGGTFNMLDVVDYSVDGNIGFISLYDVEAHGVFDNLSSIGTGIGDFIVKFSLPDNLPDADDNKYQGDSLNINFEFGAAQVAGQAVLTD